MEGITKKIRSFVKRSGRLTQAQKYALEHYKSEYMLELPLDFDESFWTHDSLILEVGFGNGASLVEMCTQHPATHYFGIEVYPAGLGNTVHHAKERELTNLRVMNADATEIIPILPDAILSGFQLYFPDPWHKKKHNKRRIVSPEFMNMLIPKLKEDAKIHMATDWEEYAYQMLDVLSNIHELTNMHSEFAPVINRPHTKFEARGKRLGHGVWDLEFKVVKSQ